MTNLDSDTVTTTKKTILSDKVYNVVKALVQIVLPSFSTLYFTLSEIWSLPSALAVVKTCAALATFLGALLAISTKAYNKSGAGFDGDMVVTRNDDGVPTISLELNDTPVDFATKKSLSFKIKPTS